MWTAGTNATVGAPQLEQPTGDEQGERGRVGGDRARAHRRRARPRPRVGPAHGRAARRRVRVGLARAPRWGVRAAGSTRRPARRGGRSTPRARRRAREGRATQGTPAGSPLAAVDQHPPQRRRSRWPESRWRRVRVPDPSGPHQREELAPVGGERHPLHERAPAGACTSGLREPAPTAPFAGY